MGRKKQTPAESTPEVTDTFQEETGVSKADLERAVITEPVVREEPKTSFDERTSPLPPYLQGDK